MTRVLIEASNQIEDWVKLGLIEVKPIVGPILVFLAVYCGIALIFALIYGVADRLLPGAFIDSQSKTGQGYTFGQLFQWSLDAYAGTFELQPTHWTTRITNIFQNLIGIFLTGVFLGYLLSRASKVFETER